MASYSRIRGLPNPPKRPLFLEEISKRITSVPEHTALNFIEVQHPKNFLHLVLMDEFRRVNRQQLTGGDVDVRVYKLDFQFICAELQIGLRSSFRCSNSISRSARTSSLYPISCVVPRIFVYFGPSCWKLKEIIERESNIVCLEIPDLIISGLNRCHSASISDIKRYLRKWVPLLIPIFFPKGPRRV